MQKSLRKLKHLRDDTPLKPLNRQPPSALKDATASVRLMKLKHDLGWTDLYFLFWSVQAAATQSNRTAKKNSCTVEAAELEAWVWQREAFCMTARLRAFQGSSRSWTNQNIELCVIVNKADSRFRVLFKHLDLDVKDVMVLKQHNPTKSLSNEFRRRKSSVQHLVYVFVCSDMVCR